MNNGSINSYLTRQYSSYFIKNKQTSNFSLVIDSQFIMGIDKKDLDIIMIGPTNRHS